MHQRVSITLPEDTIRLIDRVATKGDGLFLISMNRALLSSPKSPR